MDDHDESSRSPGLSWLQTTSTNALALRLTYRPSEDDGGFLLGELERDNELVPRFQLLTAPKPWTAASTPVDGPPHERTRVTVRSNMNWLIKSYPEAFVGVDDISSLLSEEISHLKAGHEPSSTGSLLAVGEITDQRIPDHETGHLVVASVSGQFGHILKLTLLETEQWAWGESSDYTDLRLFLKNSSPDGEGEWFQDAEPIISIKFVTDIRSSGDLRWVLVQKASSTTVLEPRIRRSPVPGEGSGRSGREGVFVIQAHLVCSITQENTGGAPHCDVSFNTYQEDEELSPPQLAIIDQAGNWSVWDLKGQLRAQPIILQPMLCQSGNLTSGTSHTMSSGSAGDGQFFRIMWLSKPRSPKSPSASFDPKLLRHKRPLPPRRSAVLLLCASHTLDIVDLQTGNVRHAIDLVSPTKNRRILQLHPCPLDPSQLFILTNKALSWAGFKKDVNGSMGLRILVSRTLHIDIDEASLQLNLSLPFFRGAGTVFASVRAAGDPGMMVFRLIRSQSETSPPCHSQFLSLGRLINSVAWTILPVSEKPLAKGTNNTLTGLLEQRKLMYCQLVTLDRDFAVSASLCAWSDAPDLIVPAPERYIQEKRTRYPQYSGHTFMLPDDIFEQTGAQRPATPLENRVSKSDATATIKQTGFGYLVAMISQRVESAIGADASSEDGSLTAHDEKLSKFQNLLHGIVERTLSSSLLLDIAGGSAGALADAHSVAANWAQLEDEIDITHPELYVGRPGSWRPELGHAALQAFWPGYWQSEQLERNTRPVLEHISTQLALSQVFLSASPSNQGLNSSEWTSQDVRSSGQEPTSSMPESQSEDTEIEDPLAARLRRYVRSLKPVARRPGGPALPLFHWDLGGDPDQTRWMDPETQKHEEVAASQRKKRDETRQKKASRNLGIFPQASDGISASPGPGSQSQPDLPYSSQSSAHLVSSSAAPEFSQPLSQVIPGSLGMRRSKSKTPGKSWGFR